MDALPYQRVDLKKLSAMAEDPATGSNQKIESADSFVKSGRVRWWIIPLSLFICCLQAACTILGDNVFSVVVTSTLLPVISFGIFFILVLLANPILDLFRRRGASPRLNRIELICLFTGMFVTSSFSTFGLAAHVVPLIPAPFNPEWNTPQAGWSENLTNPEFPLLNAQLYIQDESAIRIFREGVVLTPPPEGAPLSEFALYYRQVLKEIPWGTWVKPVSLWLIFLFGCIGIFYSLSYAVLRFWTDREKLMFPLAQLSESILPSDSSPRKLPAIFYHSGFWIGFAISATILSWNASTAAGWILPNFQFPLGMERVDARALLMDSFLSGLLGTMHSIRFLICFTAIGIAFLLPTQISFSTWFYYLVGQVMVLFAVWFGIAQSLSDFPSNFFSTANFLTAQGGGALMAFAAISIFRALKEYYVLSSGKTGAERWRLLAPVLWLAGSIVVVVLWLLWNQISLFWALVFVLFFSIFTIGMMRVVAETGVYFFQANFGFFHAFNILGVGKLVPGAFIAPLMPIYSIFFMDIKTFVAPNILTAAKLHKDSGQGRRVFHWNMILCIAVTILFSMAFMIFLAHERGAQQMNTWFFNSMPREVLNNAQGLISGTAEAFSANGMWVFLGIAWLCLTLWIRKSVFWFPHPIGYILLFNPLLASIWFSFLIGWIFKSVAVKYGGKSTFEKIRSIFIGLIFGEILAIFVWLFLGIWFGFSSGIDLNRT